MMYKINANYRRTINKNYYYVIAKTKSEAKKIFLNYISWLEIYDIELCDRAEELKVINNPYKHICVNRKESKYE